MTAILFGSISTIADTSERQREAFNRAFQGHGLQWHWSKEEYLAMLETSGGEQRIAEYASSQGQTVDPAAIHRSKSEIFQSDLANSGITARPGVVQTIQDARREGVKVGFVTTTSPDNVAALLQALEPAIQRTDFDTIVTASDVTAPKPDKASYRLALQTLDETPDACIAIEDNLGGVEAAVAAGLRCVAFPNENTSGHDFTAAHSRADRIDLEQLRKAIAVG
jgi:HAD superfamily hydrolase (TIGR01509 family)